MQETSIRIAHFDFDLVNGRHAVTYNPRNRDTQMWVIYRMKTLIMLTIKLIYFKFLLTNNY